MKVNNTNYIKSHERSFAIYEVLGKSPSWIIQNGTLIMIVIVGILVALSFIIRYPDTITAPFTLTSSSSPQKIVSSKYGKLQLFVKDGESVRKGSVLALLSNPADFSDVLKIKKNIKLILIFLSKDSSTKLEYNFNEKYQLGELQNTYEGLIESLKAFNLTNSINESKTQLKSLEQQILNQRRRNETIEKQKKISIKELDFAKKRTKLDSILYTKRVLSKSEYDKSCKDLLPYENAIERAEEAILQSNSTIIQLQKQVYELKTSQFQSKENSRSEIITKANAMLSAIDTWEENYIFKTSIDGTINLAKAWQDGDYLTANEEIMIISPNLINTYGIALMPASGIGKVSINQKVYIKLDGYPSEEYGSIVGFVKSISSVKHNNNYLVKIQLPTGLVSTYKKKLEPMQELSGSANIVTSDIRLIDRIFNQIRSLFLNK